MDDSQAEDAALVERISIRSGENQAYEKLVAKYWRLLIAWVRPRVRNASEAEDIVQETFIRAFRSLPDLKEPGRFSGWLLAIARNRSADHARKLHEVQSLDGMSEEEPAGDRFTAASEDLAERIDRREEYQAVLRAVDRLPEKYRLVVMLRYFEGFSGNEISHILDEPEGTVRNRLFRAHEKIRRLIRESSPAKGRGSPAKGDGGD